MRDKIQCHACYEPGPRAGLVARCDLWPETFSMLKNSTIFYNYIFN